MTEPVRRPCPTTRRTPSARRLATPVLATMTMMFAALMAAGPVLAGPPTTGPIWADPAGVRAAAFRWPVSGVPRPVRRFDPPPQPWSPGHRGVDLAAPPGTVVRAAGAGVVRYAGPLAGRPVISVLHAGGLRTTYEPVRPLVHVGDPVTAGQPIGVLLTGHAGCPTGSCLHWGLRTGDRYLDPLTLLGLGRVRLLPTG